MVLQSRVVAFERSPIWGFGAAAVSNSWISANPEPTITPFESVVPEGLGRPNLCSV